MNSNLIETQPTTINVIPNVLTQHADGAAAQALDRFYALQSSDFNLSELANLESRLEANLDGLYISADEGWPHYKDHLGADEYGELFTSTVLAIKLQNRERIEQVFETAADNEELLNAIADAYIWIPYDEVSEHLDTMYKTKKVELQFVAIAASAGHRQIDNGHLLDALSSSNVMLRRRALYAVAELGLKNLIPYLKNSTTHDGESIQFAACWALTRFGDANSMQQLSHFLTHPKYGELAMQLVVMQKDVNDSIAILKQLFKQKETKRLSVFGMGILGDPQCIEPLLKIMEDPEAARGAGEAFRTITGIDLAYEDLEQDAPEGFEAGPTEDPEDENVDMDPDEDLPWPNPELISQWWQQNKGRFQANKKYILGQSVSLEQYKNVLIQGTQKQRTFAALAISMHQTDQAIFNLYAPAKKQQQLLGIK